MKHVHFKLLLVVSVASMQKIEINLLELFLSQVVLVISTSINDVFAYCNWR